MLKLSGCLLLLCPQALSSSKETLARLDLSGNDLTPDVMGHVAKAIAEYVRSFNPHANPQSRCTHPCSISCSPDPIPLSVL